MKRKPTVQPGYSEWGWMNPQPKGAFSNPGPVREARSRPPHRKRLGDFRKDTKELELIGVLLDPDAERDHVQVQARKVHGEWADSWLDQEWTTPNRLSHAIDIWEGYLWNLLEEDRARWFELGGPPFAPTSERLDWRDEFQKRERAREMAFQAACKLISRFANENGSLGDDIRQCGSVQVYLYACRDNRRKHWRYWPLDTSQESIQDADDELAIKKGSFGLDAVRERIAELSKPKVIRFLGDVSLQGTSQSFIKGGVYEFLGWDAQEWIGLGLAEAATRQDLRRFEALMRELVENQHRAASDSLCQSLTAADYEIEVANKQKREEEREKNKRRFWVVEEEIPPPDSPKLIVRFLRLGTAGSCSFSVGAVYPIEKERAVRLLLEREPVVELATPEELKRDREHFSHMEAVFKDWEQKRIPVDERLVEVRILRQVRHPEKKQVVCEPGEKWKFGFDDAYRLARGRIPDAEILTKVRKKAARSGPAKDVGSGDAQSLIKSTFLHYHRYGTDKLRTEPIGSNQLALQASVSKGTASGFFGEYFGNYRAYKLACNSNEALLRKLQKINDDYVSPKSRLLGDLKSQSVKDDDE